MWIDLVHSFPQALDLLALTTCIGTLACRLWIIPCAPKESRVMHTLLSSLWRLLFACLAILSLTSVIGLIQRTAEMTGRPYSEVFPMLGVVLMNSHYGHTWFIRVLAVVMLWGGWLLGRQKPKSRSISLLMLIGAIVVALMRSAAGHGADAGDLSLPELMDWFHLLAASLWSGSMVAFTAVIFPTWFRHGEQRIQLIAGMARKFSSLAGIALAAVLLTGFYNFWIEVRTFSALWTTSYGHILSFKFLLVLALVFLGASNRFISVPLLNSLAGYSPAGLGWSKWFTLRYLSRLRGSMDEHGIVRHFARKVMAEVVIMTGVLICAALLIHETPARHQVRTGQVNHQLHLEHGSN